MDQLKSFTHGNKESLNAKTISSALTSLARDHWSSAKSRKNFGLFVFFDLRASFLTTFVAFFWLYHPQM
jgi:hypothetical protein